MVKIYCVEDDESIRQLIVYALENAGFLAQGFEEGEEFLRKTREEIPDLILLDIMLPGQDGLEILGKLRSHPDLKDLPVIMLTAKSSEYDKVRGLDMGADDYIAKPFGVMELISRVKAVLRRSQPRLASERLSLGGINLDYGKRELSVQGEKIDLTYKEFELLYILMKNKDLVLTRKTLMDQVWGFDFEGETRTIDVHIASLRQKLGDESKRIETIRNVGYKLVSRG